MSESLKPSFSVFSQENFFLLVCIFYSSGSISFYSTTLGFAFLLVLSFFYLIRHGLSNRLIKALMVWSLYCITLILHYGDFLVTVNHFVRFSTFIIASYILIVKYNTSLFFRFEKIVVLLAKISLFFWLWILINRSSLISVGSIFNIGHSGNNPDRMSDYYHILIYTIEYFSYHTTTIQRNYGFCLEPVIFSVFLVFALYFNILRNEGIKFKGNTDLIVLLIALISTQSTTGLITFMLFILYYIQSKKGLSVGKLVALIAAIVLFGIAFFFTDFLFPKIESQYQSLSDYDKISRMSNKDMRFSAGRMGGFIIGWNDIQTNPILGIGANGMRSFANKDGASLMNTNGFAGIMSMFGLFGLTLLFYLTTKTSRILSKLFKANVPLGFLLIFTLILIGSGIHRAVIFFAFMTYGFFISTNLIENNDNNSRLSNQ